MAFIHVNQLSKHYRVAAKASGLKGTLRHFFQRQYRTIEAVQEVSFAIEPGRWWAFWGLMGRAKPPP